MALKTVLSVMTFLVSTNTIHTIDKHISTLLVIVLTLLANNVEELQGVLALAGADNTQPISELLLLKELLRQVLEISAREILVCHHFHAPIAEVVDSDVIAQVTSQALDLDALLQESGELGRVEDLVVGWLRSVDDELFVQRLVCSHDNWSNYWASGSIAYLLCRLLALLAALGASSTSGRLLLHFQHLSIRSSQTYCAMPLKQ